MSLEDFMKNIVIIDSSYEKFAKNTFFWCTFSSNIATYLKTTQKTVLKKCLLKAKLEAELQWQMISLFSVPYTC